MIRWLYLIKYPEGVPVDQGERWYLGTHTQEAKEMAEHGLARYRTWKALEAPFGAGSKSRDELNTYKRMTELAFPDWDSFKAALIDNPREYTGASYGRPFEYQTIFVGDEPEYDLLKDVPKVD